MIFFWAHLIKMLALSVAQVWLPEILFIYLYKKLKIKVMYRIKKSMLNHLMKYSIKTSLDLKGTYSKEEWNKNGFKDSMLEKV